MLLATTHSAGRLLTKCVRSFAPTAAFSFLVQVLPIQRLQVVVQAVPVQQGLTQLRLAGGWCLRLMQSLCCATLCRDAQSCVCLALALAQA
jgi:hypothetical protein